ncbi:amphi-Trp domain-containing protein [Desulfovibrio aminophilus]|nr:amphi-Trp domain-containing protein [Desulfovibrio aminophilus]MCM0756435.1 amphi-Trp domain-containing protein [Desulfovibrio aminophilus]
MEKEKCKVSIDQYVEVKQVVAYLEDLVKGLKAGSIMVQHGEESVVLTLPDMVEMEIEAKQKKDKSKFVLELSWRAAPAVAKEGECCKDKEGKAEAPAAKPAEPAEKKPAEAPKPMKK